MYRLDLISERWKDKSFTSEQMQKHLLECNDLLLVDDDHFINELIDLKIIIDHYLQFFCDKSIIDEVKEKRLAKFNLKARND